MQELILTLDTEGGVSTTEPEGNTITTLNRRMFTQQPVARPSEMEKNASSVQQYDVIW